MTEVQLSVQEKKRFDPTQKKYPDAVLEFDKRKFKDKRKRLIFKFLKYIIRGVLPCGNEINAISSIFSGSNTL